MLRRLALLFVLALAACGASPAATTATTGTGGATASSSSTTTTGTSGAAGSGGSVPDGGKIDKAAACTGTFGAALTNSFGRLDGTVLAVVQPSDTQCPMPNSDHLILEVTMSGDVYRMVVNLQSTIGDPNVLYLALDHALPAPPWTEGWHTGLALDYVADYGVHVGAFTAHPLTELSGLVTDTITLGQKISVYASSSGGASAHLVHRNDGKVDGAIVLRPDTAAPRALLFHFADQTF